MGCKLVPSRPPVQKNAIPPLPPGARGAIRARNNDSCMRQHGVPVGSNTGTKIMAKGSARPLSPHLSIWKWGPAMTVSILHRISGNGLAVAGLLVLLWFIGAIASGPEAYVTFARHADTWYGMIVLIGISWAFFNHLASGVRHLVLDIGAGLEVDRNKAWSIVSILAGIALTVAFWAVIRLA